MQARHIIFAVILLANTPIAWTQPYGRADRENAGDEMIQSYLQACTEEVETESAWDMTSWQSMRGQYMEEYMYMLGLRPMPEKTPLCATVTGTLQGDGYVVEMVHYQSRPRLYVTGNLYRPTDIAEGARLPAVLYVCGHANCDRDGNKTAYQSHGIWLARHGYICLMLDTLQLGEIGAIHHGTYREGRWWWHSRGYTPAGVECLNGIRAIDYLVSRPDVDSDRIAVTGISGGGAATFWIAAADERVKAAVPVSGMADLMSYVPNRVINGHCDCMFLYNTFQWPWTRIAALIAPRPLLFVNSDADSIFPMDANERVINRLERVYSLYGASDLVDAVVSIGGHSYRQDLRQAAYRFINIHLKGDPRIVTDSEVDLVIRSGNERICPIEPRRLRVFPQDDDLPKDELNTTIDEHFVAMAHVEPPQSGDYAAWRDRLMGELRRVVFRCLPKRIPAAELVEQSGAEMRLASEKGIQISLWSRDAAKAGDRVKRVVLIVQGGDSDEGAAAWMERLREAGDCLYVCRPRGIGPTRWTRKNPPNYVERSHVLLGRTVDTGRVWDVAAAARFLADRYKGRASVYTAGEGPAGVLAAYAALLEPEEIAGVILHRPTLSHMQPEAPQFLNVLRVCDVPDILGMLAPRPLVVYGVTGESLKKTCEAYNAAGCADRLSLRRESVLAPGQ
ncbi:MAG TPA: prolyl oligopeptidase family serine peptidase [Anaerohalosphaeraceae bacterium]|jgi:dienelactone hydrolase|nr:prolyl oligopeptidase family serine peptidase [Anaerohalosphaeraceae bacterium]HRT50231.1 prolyl oligopeptidase family serine peptidase [Anaerohalosphaeraceae bacterium]HRT86162.1 prolyl oligopeptidase family serine peptidase [Anaerohalosphaeraceae bacterium]